MVEPDFPVDGLQRMLLSAVQTSAAKAEAPYLPLQEATKDITLEPRMVALTAAEVGIFVRTVWLIATKLKDRVRVDVP